MYFVTAARTAAMERAHGDPRVGVVTGRFLRAQSDGMLKLLVQTLWGNWDPKSLRSLILSAGIPNELHSDAYEMGAAALEIAGEANIDHRKRCRGAIVERLAEGLVRRRPRDVRTEQRVGPFPDPPWTGGVSDPIDLVLVDGPHELYECKADVHRIASKHVEQFGIISGLEGAEQATLAFVTLQRASLLVEWLSEFSCRCQIHAFTYEDFLAMETGPARLQVAGPATT